MPSEATMAAISTEGRIFAETLKREIAVRERKGAAMLSPGTDNWHNAFKSFLTQAHARKSPTKAAKFFKEARNRLVAAHNSQCCTLNAFAGRSRSAFLEVLVCEVGQHPLVASKHDGIVVTRYQCILSRRGQSYEFRFGDNLAFIHWHALGRLGERCKIDVLNAGGLLAICGVVGLLMRESSKHCGTELNLAFTDILLTGTLRYVINDTGDHWRGFFDVLTTLEHTDGVQRQLKITQGAMLADMALKYMQGDDADPSGWANKIPVLPFHEDDYVSREIGPQKLVLSGVAPQAPTI
jgi:hypothetical protein